MSTYLNRIYETVSPIVHETTSEFDSTKYSEDKLFDGFTVRVYWDKNNPYQIWDAKEGKFIAAQQPKKVWKMARWYNAVRDNVMYEKPTVYIGDIVKKEDYEDYIPILAEKGEALAEHFAYGDNGGVIRDEFVRCGGEYDEIFGMRGMPPDLSDGAKEVFALNDSVFDITYITLSELRQVADAMLEKYKRETENEMLDGKLGEILSLLKKDTEIRRGKKKNDYDDYYYDDYTYIDRYEAIMEEYFRCNAMTDYMYAYDTEDKRIIFFLT